MNKIVITHTEIVDCDNPEQLILGRLTPTGALNVASGVIVREDDPMLDVFAYRVSFDPWYWTGRQEPEPRESANKASDDPPPP